MRKSSSINSISVAIEREIKPTNYDEVLIVGQNIAKIVDVADNLPAILNVDGQSEGITAIINNILKINTVANNIDVVLNSLSPVSEQDYCPGYPFNFLSTTSFSVIGYDVTKIFYKNKRLKFFDGGNAYYGTVLTSIYGTDTTITLSMELGDVLTTTITDVCTTTSNTSWIPIAKDPFSGTSINAVTSGIIGATNYVVAVGNSGKAFYSVDGGDQWTEIVNNVTSNFNDVAYNEDNQAFLIVGDNGTILESLDMVTWVDYSTEMVTHHGAGTYHINKVIWYNYGYLEWFFITSSTSTTTGSFISAVSDFSNSIQFIDSLTNQDHTALTIRKEASSKPILTGYNSTVSYWDNTRSTYLTASTYSVTGSVTDIVSHPNNFDNSGGRFLCVSDTGELRSYFSTNYNSIKSGNSNPLRSMAISPIGNHNRIVVVGDNGYIGVVEATDYNNGNAIDNVQNGFSPTTTINAVHWNAGDGLFIAVAANGQIAKSTNGITI